LLLNVTAQLAACRLRIVVKRKNNRAAAERHHGKRFCRFLFIKKTFEKVIFDAR
jgi:RNase P protein component